MERYDEELKMVLTKAQRDILKTLGVSGSELIKKVLFIVHKNTGINTSIRKFVYHNFNTN